MRKPTLLWQFSIVSLVLFAVMGLILGWGLTRYMEEQAIEQQKQAVASLVQPVVGNYITDDVLRNGALPVRTPEAAPLTDQYGYASEASPASGEAEYGQSEDPQDAYSVIERALGNLGGVGLARVRIWNRDGMIIYSDEKDSGEIGRREPLAKEMEGALEGLTSARISPLSEASNVERFGFSELLEVVTPLRQAGKTEISGVFEGYYDIDDLRDRIDDTHTYLWLSIANWFAVLYIALFTIVRNASRRITTQDVENAALLADTRRKAARLQVVNELARSINRSALDLNRVFDTALRGVGRVVDHNGAGIVLLEKRPDAGLSGFALPVEESQPAFDGPGAELSLELLGSADTFRCADSRLHEHPALREMGERGLLSLLLASISLGERRLGVLWVTGEKAAAFSVEDASILKGLADQLAVAIENVRLIRETAETTALRETNRLKDEFVSMVSHELRTPLASIKGYSRTLMSADGNWDAETRREFLHIIAEESDKLTDLVENLLEMSRIEGGRLPIMPEPIILRRFCREVMDRIGNHYPEIRFECALADGLPMIEADPRRVEQVLMNLLQNAAKYSGANVVKVSGCASGREVIISVSDNGVGIKSEHLPHLFDKFYRVEVDRGELEGGTGLGLAISRALVEAQSGRIWVESMEGRGTTFHFTLPALIVEEEQSTEPGYERPRPTRRAAQ